MPTAPELTTADASILAACTTLSGQLALGPVTPRVIGRFSNLVVALEPLPIVARVATGTAALRNPLLFAQRECAIAAFLAEAGAPALAPCSPPLAGPHDVDGFILSLWPRIKILTQPVDPALAARALKHCHRTLRGYDNPSPQLPFFEELDHLLAHPSVLQVSSEHDRAFVAEQAAHCRRALTDARQLCQPLHGDAHLKNVFSTDHGPLWADWEDTCSAPIEWDLACLVTGARIENRDLERAEAALVAYGSYDPVLLKLCIRARALFGMGWLWLLSLDHQRRSERLTRAAHWIDWLRRNN